jgi:hypothetical protein
MKAKQHFIGQPVVLLGSFATMLGVLAAMALVAPTARASDPTGVYAFVDRVIFEPGESAPERIQVWGGFALAKKTANNSEYNEAQRGYLYLKLRPGEEEVCKKEWADLKAVAGTKEIVAFGSRYEAPQPKLRKPDEKVENPDVHPKSWSGIVKTGERRRDHPPIGQLLKLMPTPAKEASKTSN